MHTYKIPKLDGVKIITTKEVMDKLRMFQDIYGEIDDFGWLYLEIFSADVGKTFTSKEFQDEWQTLVLRYQLRRIRKLTDKSK